MSAAGQPCQTDMAALVKSLELFGLESTAAKTIAAKLVLEQGHRGQTYLQLQLPPSAVRFVDTEECLLEAFSALEEDGAMGVLGLDCEWDSAAGRWAPVSILQVCGTMVTEPVSGCPHHPSLKAYIHDQGLNMRACQCRYILENSCIGLSTLLEWSQCSRWVLHATIMLLRQGVAHESMLCLADSVQEHGPDHRPPGAGQQPSAGHGPHQAAEARHPHQGRMCSLRRH